MGKRHTLKIKNMSVARSDIREAFEGIPKWLLLDSTISIKLLFRAPTPMLKMLVRFLVLQS